ncbi:MAG: HlyD family efflux transporter periplasmic adaptor subunit [Methylomarinum sp.]|nr:HlyD family efflux transporter periplasmic adaptor subunit [Methylomarinum sp.]
MISIKNIRAINKKAASSLLTVGLLGFLAGHFSYDNQSEHALSAVSTPSLSSSPISGQLAYTCPMHPDVISDRPGDCPVCGMPLVAHQHDHTQHDQSFPAVRISPTVAHNLGVSLAQVSTGKMQHYVETIGKITRIDPTARQIITPPIQGELVYIVDKYDDDEVTKGELLFSIASPELFTLQEQYQQAFLSDDTTAATLLMPRLQKHGLTAEQISQLQHGHAAELPVHVYAQEEGYIFSRRSAIGDNIPTGFTVFNLSGSGQTAEVTAEIFERQWGWVKVNQTANMTVRGIPGISFVGKVVRVEPPVGYTTRSLEIKIKFKTDNPGLSQSMFAHISIAAQSRNHVLQVPQDAVIKTGDGDRVVRVLADGHYQPVAVVSGEQSAGMIEIRSGLKENDTVVTSGQFLIDSESNLQADFLRMSNSRSPSSFKDDAL